MKIIQVSLWITILVSLVSCKSDESQTMTIGSQNWNISNETDTTGIEYIQDSVKWVKAAEDRRPAYCYNVDSKGKIKSAYGPLYNYYAALKLQRTGMRLPKDSDWKQLVTSSGGAFDAGKKIKQLFGVSKYYGTRMSDGHFEGFNVENSWWSSELALLKIASTAYTIRDTSDYIGTYYYNLGSALSVRLIQDLTFVPQHNILDSLFPKQDNTVKLGPQVRCIDDSSYVRGERNAVDVLTKIKSHTPGIGFYYKKAMNTSPQIQGYVRINFQIAEDGSITEARVANSNISEKKLIEKTLELIKYINVNDGSTAEASVYLTFKND